MLRLPDGMRDRLKATAEANKRSLNAEIVARLEWSLDRDLTDDGDEKHSLLNPAGLAAMRDLAADAVRNLTEMKGMIAEAKAVAFQLIEEREAAEARKSSAE